MLPIEPYEDPDTEPGFVRTEKAFLKEKSIRDTAKEVEKRTNLLISMTGMHTNKSIDSTFLKDVDRGSAMN